MEEKEYKALKAKFLSFFANVPQPLRKEIIVVVGEDTFNWSSAKAELTNDTEKAHIILEQLKKMDVI
jgi:hypothetical protein